MERIEKLNEQRKAAGVPELTDIEVAQYKKDFEKKEAFDTKTKAINEALTAICEEHGCKMLVACNMVEEEATGIYGVETNKLEDIGLAHFINKTFNK